MGYFSSVSHEPKESFVQPANKNDVRRIRSDDIIKVYNAYKEGEQVNVNDVAMFDFKWHILVTLSSLGRTNVYSIIVHSWLY